MKIFLRILLVILMLLFLLVIIGFFLPSKVHTSRSYLIKAPQNVVFDQVNNLRNWENWSPWHKIDTLMKLEYSDTFIGKNAYYTWKSENKKVGSGRLTITSSSPYDSITTEMDFMEQGLSMAYFIFSETDSGTYVTWGFNTDMGKNPFVKYFGLFMNKYIEKDYDKGLKNLASVCENLPVFKVELTDITEFHFVSIKKSCNWEDVSAVMTQSYDRLMKYIQSSNAEMTGAPYSIYHDITDGEVMVEMGIPVNLNMPAKGDIASGTYPDTKVASLDYFGFYDNLDKAHGFLQDWLTKMNLEVEGLPMEQYITDPSTEPDTAKWLTRINYPVKM